MPEYLFNDADAVDKRDRDRRYFHELMNGPTEEYKSEIWRCKAIELADECDFLVALLAAAPSGASALADKFDACDHAAFFFDAGKDEEMRREALAPEDYHAISGALRGVARLNALSNSRDAFEAGYHDCVECGDGERHCTCGGPTISNGERQ